MTKDIRWQQRFENYKNAFARLENAANLQKERKLTDLEEQGLIKAFEFTFELSWKVMKDFLEDMGILDIIGSRGSFREAFKNNIIQNGEVWMDMVEARNLTTHTYDENIKNEIISKIINAYYKEFLSFKETMQKKVK
ncbi:MAG: nucleotidyltransferase substrate binding protein [Elusimicrobiota bacterium]|jgi:nucleotidyltransferase substrate binding protein (TIGR01987 family)|nr:nucleotidyltransferase substrate binding protein [Elusimicrobiota bacterium]